MLAQLIAFGRKVDARGEDDKVLVVVGAHAGGDIGQSASGNEAQHEALVFTCVVDRSGGVSARSERALGGHLGENEEATVRAIGEVGSLGCLRQSFDNTLAGQDGAVDDVGPFGDAEGSLVVLLLDGVADVDEFAVLEDEEVVFLGEGLEASDSLVAEIGEDVDVGFYDGDIGTEAYCIQLN